MVVFVEAICKELNCPCIVIYPKAPKGPELDSEKKPCLSDSDSDSNLALAVRPQPVFRF